MPYLVQLLKVKTVPLCLLAPPWLIFGAVQCIETKGDQAFLYPDDAFVWGETRRLERVDASIM